MIKLTKLNGQDIFINPDLIGNMECNPHTVLHMTSGETIVVKETSDQVVDKIVEYKRRIFRENT